MTANSAKETLLRLHQARRQDIAKACQTAQTVLTQKAEELSEQASDGKKSEASRHDRMAAKALDQALAKIQIAQEHLDKAQKADRQ